MTGVVACSWCRPGHMSKPSSSVHSYDATSVRVYTNCRGRVQPDRPGHMS